MPTYHVQLVGEPQHAQPITEHDIGVRLPHYAVAEAAGCAWENVGLPVWRRGPRCNGAWDVECYMPADNTGRQWLVLNPGV